MTHVAYPGCYCADCVEGTPSARITGDKDRENPVEGAPTAPTNRWLEAEVKRLREALLKCAEPSRYHAPCPSCGPKIVEQGCYIARAALKDTRHDT